ncbi:MAG: hypothetical protein ACREL7_12120 [Longimicrobiales bacterium]
MVQWLAPICLFWILAAIYLGGTRIEIHGGGPRQLFGVLGTFALYLGVWALTRMVAGGLGEIPSVLVAIVVASLLIPVVARIAFRVVGVKLSRAPAH